MKPKNPKVINYKSLAVNVFLVYFPDLKNEQKERVKISIYRGGIFNNFFIFYMCSYTI